MKIVIDHNILYIEGSQSTLNLLDQNNLTYSIEENNCKYSIQWYRKVINICSENHEVSTILSTDTIVSILLFKKQPTEAFLFSLNS